MIVGNPGRQIGWMSEGGETLKFDSSNSAFVTNLKNTIR